MSPRPKEPCSLCASSVPAAGSKTGCITGMGDMLWPQAAGPWECPAEHAMGQPPVGNEERPLFTVTNKRDKKPESQDTSLPISPALQQGGVSSTLTQPQALSLAWRDGTNSCWGSFGTNQATLPHPAPPPHPPDAHGGC